MSFEIFVLGCGETDFRNPQGVARSKSFVNITFLDLINKFLESAKRRIDEKTSYAMKMTLNYLKTII